MLAETTGQENASINTTGYKFLVVYCLLTADGAARSSAIVPVAALTSNKTVGTISGGYYTNSSYLYADFQMSTTQFNGRNVMRNGGTVTNARWQVYGF